MVGTGRKLPRGHVYDLLWTLPHTFGGVTRATLLRCNAFADLAGHDVTVLTLSPTVDPEGIRAHLIAEGLLSRRVRVRNVWAELLALSDRQLRRFCRAGGQPTVPPAPSDAPGTWGPPDAHGAATRSDDEGRVLQVDRSRADDTVLLSDQRDTRKPGEPGGRTLTLFDRRGRPLAQWSRARDLYYAWLDWVTEGRESSLICDSKFVANFLTGYRRDHVTVASVIHTTHLKGFRGPSPSLVKSTMHGFITGLDSFDLVAALTAQQRDELVSASYAADNIATIPNSFTGQISDLAEPRPAHTGLVVGRLADEKRIEHALQALARARAAGVRTSLDICGEGDREEHLRKVTGELGLDEAVTFTGYDPRARERFMRSSYSVLSSRFEGQSLVLLESMAGGCIPIAYDIRYGPSDIITDGVDGFLVPEGDVDGLAHAVERVVTMDAGDLMEMRRAAVRRVRDFGPEKVVAQWAEVLGTARARKQPVRKVKAQAALSAAEAEPTGIRVTARLTGLGRHLPERAMLAWRGTATTAYGRVPAEVGTAGAETRLEALIPYERFASCGAVRLGVFADLVVRGNPRRVRLAAPGLETPAGDGATSVYRTRNGNLGIRSDRRG